MKNFIQKTPILQTLALTTALLWQTTALADVSVIAHPSTPIGSIDANTVKSIYLGKLKSWPNGTALIPVDQAPGTETRKIFLKKVVSKKEIKFDSYWSKKAFSGKGVPPKALGNDADVKAFVAQTKGSIGFIDTSTADASIKVLMTIK